MKKMQSKTKNKPWRDQYTDKAKKDGYPARSVFKLSEIQKKYNLIKKGNTVLDLGCSPGSWTLYASKIVGGHGQVIGIDLNDVNLKLPSNTRIFKGDIYQFDHDKWHSIVNIADVVLSDMAPKTTGRKEIDAARSTNLCHQAITIADGILKPAGHFVCKVFQGNMVEDIYNAVKEKYNRMKIIKPTSSKKASKEIFVIGFGKI